MYSKCNTNHQALDITVTTKGCPAGEVKVFDTIFDKLDYETRDIIKRMSLIKNCS